MPPKYFFQLLIGTSLFLSAFIKSNNTTHPTPSFLLISDIHLNSGATQNAAHGDTGDSLWLAAKKEIDTLIANKNVYS